MGYFRKKSADFIKDEHGQSMLEYAVIAAGAAVPIGLVFDGFMDVVVSYYALISIIVGLPFP